MTNDNRTRGLDRGRLKLHRLHGHQAARTRRRPPPGPAQPPQAFSAVRSCLWSIGVPSPGRGGSPGRHVA